MLNKQNNENNTAMKKLALFAVVLCCALTAFAKGKKEAPATVIITAGQSNTDGRVLNTQLPDYIQQHKYKYCQWCYGSAGKVQTDGFETFWPKMVHPQRPGRWAYDGKYWSADPDWLAANRSTLTGGKSLLLSFTELIDTCIDNRLSKLPQGYEIKAFLWHQGESDRHQGKNYYENLKAVVTYVREHLVEKTGEKKYRKLPFICGTVSRKNKQYNADVEAALYQLAKEDKNFYVIDMADAELQRDQLHFTAASAEYLGKQMYNRLVDLGVAGKRAEKIE